MDIYHYPSMNFSDLAWHLRLSDFSDFTWTQPELHVQGAALAVLSICQHCTVFIHFSILSSHMPLRWYIRVMRATLKNETHDFRASYNRDLFLMEKSGRCSQVVSSFPPCENSESKAPFTVGVKRLLEQGSANSGLGAKSGCQLFFNDP